MTVRSGAAERPTAPPTCALMWSGGKDSWLALHRALSRGLNVSTLINLFEQDTGRVRFHAIHRELIAAQAFALGLRLHQYPVPPDGYEPVFQAALTALASSGYHGVVFGNIHLVDVRRWFESRVRAAGLEHIEPLWQEPPAALLHEFVATGARAVITCVDPAQLPAAWLGRVVDEALATDLARRPAVDPCGERGEYHTFVFGGPRFATPLAWRPGRIRGEAGFSTLEVLPR